MTEGATKMAGPQTSVIPGSSIYAKPSLPYLLTEYGFEDREANELRKEQRSREYSRFLWSPSPEGEKKEEQKKKKKLQKKQSRKMDSFDDYEDEKDREREREQDEHYEQMVKDLHRLRDFYYREYTGMLAEKVQRQRKEQKERDAEIQRQKEKDAAQAAKESHRVKKRLERHTLATTPMTEDVPKTDLYHIVGLEHKLRKEGKLKTISDYNKFREDMSHPRLFNAYLRNKLGDSKSCGSTEYASTRDASEVFSLAPDMEMEEMLRGNLHPQQPQQQSQNQRSLSRISEGREGSRPGTRTEHWAITQQFPSSYKSRKSIAQIGKQKSEYKMDLERRFPKLEMPKLHCFTMNLAKKPPDPEEVRQQLELRAREKQRKRAVRTYTKMYQLAMSNAAVSSRIFNQHEDMDMLLHGPDLCDVIADNHWLEAYGLTEIHPEDMNYHIDEEAEEGGEYTEVEESPPSALSPQAPLPEIGQVTAASTSQVGSGQELSLTAGESPAGASPGVEDEAQASGPRTKSAKSSAKSKKSGESTKIASPLPLTMDEIHGECNIKEAKTLSTLWTNYMRAGKQIGQ